MKNRDYPFTQFVGVDVSKAKLDFAFGDGKASGSGGVSNVITSDRDSLPSLSLRTAVIECMRPARRPSTGTSCSVADSSLGVTFQLRSPSSISIDSVVGSLLFRVFLVGVTIGCDVFVPKQRVVVEV